MTADAAPPYLPAFGSHTRKQVGQELQATLVELVDLSLLGKQLHWSVVAPHFRALHLQLDELIESWRDLADTVAERAVTIGFWPDGQADSIAASPAHQFVQGGAIGDRDVVRKLTRLLAELSERVRERMDKLGELDLVTQDVLIGVTRTLERHLWMIRTQQDLGMGG